MKMISFTIRMEPTELNGHTPDLIMNALHTTMTTSLGIDQFTLELNEGTVTLPDEELPYEFPDFEEDHSFDDDLFEDDDPLDEDWED